MNRDQSAVIITIILVRGELGVHVFTSFCTILEDYMQLFISPMFPVTVSSFVDLNVINLIPVSVWKIKLSAKTAIFDR